MGVPPECLQNSGLKLMLFFLNPKDMHSAILRACSLSSLITCIVPTHCAAWLYVREFHPWLSVCIIFLALLYKNLVQFQGFLSLCKRFVLHLADAHEILTVSGSFSKISRASSLLHSSSTHSLSKFPFLLSSIKEFALRFLTRYSEACC